MMRLSVTWVWMSVLGIALLGCKAKPSLPAPSKAAIQDKSAFVSDANAFAIDLYKHLRAKPGNVLLSPYSVSAAMGMLDAGAGGETEKQMRQTMQYSLESARQHPAFGALMYGLSGGDQKPGYDLVMANALWTQKNRAINPAYLTTLRKFYDAGVENKADFEKAADAAVKEINRWAGEKTSQKIKEVITSGVLTDQTRAVMISAACFKGEWASQFDKKLTLNLAFHTTTGVQVQVPMMQQESEFRYLKDSHRDYQVLEMPYKGNELSMVLLLPDDPNALPYFERRLGIMTFNYWIGELSKTKIIVYLPKFILASQSDLKGTLQEMGMKDAFDPKTADFSKVTDKKDLFLSNVIQKTCVEVSEEGSVATAPSGAVMGLKSMPGQSPIFRADHPFLFFIKDNRTSAILFMGRVANPAQ